MSFTLSFIGSQKTINAVKGIKKEEFTEFILDQNLGVTKEQAEAMFDHADCNGDGYLCADELAEVSNIAKGSAMTLPVRMIVPSTQDVSGKISEEEMRIRCDQVISFFAATFGGATASAMQRGAYRSDSGEIIFEEVQSVTSFCTRALWEENVEMVRGRVAEFCGEWGQECIGLEFAGFLEYIYATPPSPEDLWTSVVSRIRKRRQLGWTPAADTVEREDGPNNDDESVVHKSIIHKSIIMDQQLFRSFIIDHKYP